MLKASDEMQINYGEFLDICRSNLSNTKFEFLQNLSVDSKDGPLISEWAEFYKSFKEELTYQRNMRSGIKSQLPNVRDSKTTTTIASAISNKNPLDAEEMLLSLQFQKLDELIGTHYFDEYALFGYALKLKLLERKKMFNQESGKKEFNHIIDTLQEQIINMEQE